MQPIQASAIVLRRWLTLGLLFLAAGMAHGERLPVKIYTTADGLAHNMVNHVVRDSRGFLWFCTDEGLSRFDGYAFTNYGIADGLPSPVTNVLLETRQGEYWLATGAGLCRFNPSEKQPSGIRRVGQTGQSPAPMFTAYFPDEDPRSKTILSLLQDRAGHIWCGTRNGLYRVEAADDVTFTSIDLGIPDQFESRYIYCLLEDRHGSLWIGSRNGLYRRWPDGRVEAYGKREGLPYPVILSLLEDREGRIWVGTGWGGLCRLVANPSPGRPVVARAYTRKDGLPSRTINELIQATDGSLWAGCGEGLVRFIPIDDGRDFRFRVYAQAHGLSTPFVASLAEDRNGNLWLATSGGIAKLTRNGFTAFDKTDGFSQSTSVFESKAGDIIVLGRPAGPEWFINRFDGETFIPIRPRLSEYVKKRAYGWGWNQTLLEDHTGEWWIATFAGVCRFPKVSRPEQLAQTPPRAIYTTRDGLATDLILRLFEDSRGDIWIGTVGHGVRSNGLSRWERRTNTFHHYTAKDNLPRLDTFFVSSFAEDRAGNVWIGFSGDAGLARYRDGRFSLLSASEGVPPGQLRNMILDSAGRLWIANLRSGLVRIDEPSAERPRIVTYTTADGLSSNQITAVNEDQWGRIYVGTGRGLDRLDPGTGRVKHYTTADGLPLGDLHSALRDRNGTLWFSFQTGPARFVPEPDLLPVPPPILITALRIAGERQPISALGEAEMGAVELGPDKNQLQIDFVALGFGPGEGLRYQYKLEGASEDWSHLADQRSLNFANLAPGRYRFLVRAVNADGVVSEQPASYSFTILPPVWRRGWFLALAAALVGLMVYSFYRYRVRRVLELERVRTRIATDLHDDLGSSLSQIAILSEVVRRRLDLNDSTISNPLAIIASTSRELVDSMGDIVWAINPQRDSLRDLTHRLRQFAGDVFSSRDIEFELHGPSLEHDIKLDINVRREVFLIGKEAINNIARHANCSTVVIGFELVDGSLLLSVSDNGRGFDSRAESDGHGLMSMRQRARNIGGQLRIVSEPGQGTAVVLSAPLGKRRRFSPSSYLHE